MRINRQIRLVFGLMLLGILVAPLAPSKAAGPDKKSDQTLLNQNDKTPIDLFDAMKLGDIAVKFIPHDSLEGHLLVTNKTDRPLTIKLPEAFAAVPVLAQAANPPATTQKSYNNNNNQNQGLGGGMSRGHRRRRGGIRRGAFDVAPEKVAKLKVETVCLEHGKKSQCPRPLRNPPH